MNPISPLGHHVQHPSQASPRLLRAAEEFEGQMMKELLKPLNQPDALTSADESGDGSTGALGDFAKEALGQALSRQGGFGIANSIVGQLSRSRTGSGSAKVTKPVHVDTQLRTLR